MQIVIPVTLIDRFAFTIEAICQALARHNCPRTGALPRVPTLLMVLIHNRLRRYKTRFIRYAAAFAAAAALTPSTHPAAAQHPIPKPPAPRRAPRPQRPEPPCSAPRSFAWLARLAPEARQYAGQLAHLLMEPEMAALLKARPTLGRTLRPLCRALGIRKPPIPPEPSSVATLLLTPSAASRSRTEIPPAPPPVAQPPAAPPPASPFLLEKTPS